MKTLFTFVLGAVCCLSAGYFSYQPAQDQPRRVLQPQALVADTFTYDPALQGRNQYVRSVDVPVRKVTFGGERVPMNQRDLIERFDRELLTYTYWHSHSMMMIKRANRWFPQMAPIIRQYGLPDDLKYVVAVESVFQNVVSPVGAVGFWQIMEETGRELGLEINEEVDERYHPLKATHAACKYIKQLRGRYGDYATALAAYNAGMGRIERALSAQQQDTYYQLLLNEETSRYVFRILAAKEIIERPTKYGIHVPQEHRYPIEPVRKVQVTKTIGDLTQWAIDQGISYKLLKQFNPWLRTNRLTVSGEKTYVIDIPTQPTFDPEMEEMQEDSLETATDSLLRGDATVTPDTTSLAHGGTPELEQRRTPVDTTSGSQVRPAVEKKQGSDEKARPRRRRVPLHYRVRWYDTMARVARKHGVEEEQIVQWNQLPAGDLKAGQTLVLYVADAPAQG